MIHPRHGSGGEGAVCQARSETPLAGWRTGAGPSDVSTRHVHTHTHSHTHTPLFIVFSPPPAAPAAASSDGRAACPSRRQGNTRRACPRGRGGALGASLASRVPVFSVTKPEPEFSSRVPHTDSASWSVSQAGWSWGWPLAGFWQGRGDPRGSLVQGQGASFILCGSGA